MSAGEPDLDLNLLRYLVVLVQEGDLGRALSLAAMHLVASLVLTAFGFAVYRSLS
jgi:hypothetical protein